MKNIRLLSFTVFFFSIATGQNPALISTVCGPIELESWSTFLDEPKTLCMAVVTENYAACTEISEGDFDDRCGLAQCQNSNWCEVSYPCQQTVIPGLQILECSTTLRKYPPYSQKGLFGDPHTANSLATVISLQALPPYVRNAMQVWDSVGPFVVSQGQSVMAALESRGVGQNNTQATANWILKSTGWLPQANLTKVQQFGAAHTGCVGECNFPAT